MKLKNKKVKILFLIFSIILIAKDVYAEKKKEKSEENKIKVSYKCYLDIFYTWEQENNNKNKKKKSIKVKEFFKTVYSTSEDKEKASNILKENLESYKSEALDDCKRKHNNMANCISVGLRKNSKEYIYLDFNTKKLLTDSIKEDCKQKTGKCLSSTSNELICRKIEIKEDTPSNTKKKK